MPQAPQLFSKVKFERTATNILEYIRKVESDSYDRILYNSHEQDLDQLEKKKLTKNVLLPKPDVPIEWWYFTGHLESDAKKYGFEWCMFKIHPKAVRFGFIPLSFLRKKPFLVLHTAITDVTGEEFKYKHIAENIHPSQINYQKLEVELAGNSVKFDGDFDIKSEQMDLKISPEKDLIMHFDGGYLMMDERTNSSTYYVTFPRSTVSGKIRLGEEEIQVKGECWFDHQKSVVPHGSSMLGWDWFSIMLDDNTELMLVTLRDKKGLRKRGRVGTYVKADGKVVNLIKDDFEVKKLGTWHSEKTGIGYPSGWQMSIPQLELEIKVTPYLQDQEINSSLSTPICYWEGACKVEGTKQGKPITGNSYAELVGYDNRMITQVLRSQSA